VLCAANTLQIVYLLFSFQKVYIGMSQKKRMKQELVTDVEETERVLVIFKILLRRRAELLNVVFEDLEKIYVNKTSELV